ncbi:MAG: helix-turn-helix transcriptional regulator [Clostridia bacterium]|nr:helix-turn-helix transcriptional regulator [Clostridia bacterium]
MQHNLLGYISTNGIRLHHVLSTFQKGETESLRTETHYLYEMFYLINGKATYHINGQDFALRKNDMIIVPPNAVHSITFDPSEDCERMALSFTPHLLPRFINIDLLYAFRQTFSIPRVIRAKNVKALKFYEYYENCRQLCMNKNSQTDMFLLSNIFQLIAKLNLYFENLPEKEKVNDSDLKTQSLSYLCIQYVNSHLKENISIEDLAKELKFSVSHIRQTFKKESGLTLHNYIFIQKMQLANQLLQEGKNPVTVASELGYEYYSTFYHNYVKRFNYPPKALSAFDYQRVFGEDIDQ